MKDKTQNTPECPNDQRAWNIWEVEDYGFGIFTTNIWLKLRDSYTQVCDHRLMSAVIKGSKAVHADMGYWIESEKNETWKLARASFIGV
ncbi:hypothetical protein C1165_00060, partial [Klebsiella pneumoniae]